MLSDLQIADLTAGKFLQGEWRMEEPMAKGIIVITGKGKKYLSYYSAQDKDWLPKERLIC